MKLICLSGVQLLGDFTDHCVGNSCTNKHPPTHTRISLFRLWCLQVTEGELFHARAHTCSIYTSTHTHRVDWTVSQWFLSSCHEMGGGMRQTAGILSRPVDLCDPQIRYIFCWLSVSSSTYPLCQFSSHSFFPPHGPLFCLPVHLSLLLLLKFEDSTFQSNKVLEVHEKFKKQQ